jgi:hypothetical protein
MAITPKHSGVTLPPTRAHRSAGAVAFAASFVLLAGFTAAACGGNSSAGHTPGGSAGSANGGEGDVGSGGSSANTNTGGSSGSSHTTGGSSSATGGSDAAGGDASGGTTSGGSTSGGSTSGGTTSGGTTSGGSSATGGTGTAGSGVIGGTTACDNGLDDDNDGLADGFDPECTGPWDNDEGSFATGIPGDNQDPKWQDCFFDGNSGGGDDGCRYSTSCLTGDLAADDEACSLAQNCIDYCAKLTPNGCDCFGCCTIQANDGSSVDIYTTSSCSLDQLDDEAACPRCQKSLDCQNTCGECELCPGKTEADLPESCTPPPTTGTGGSSGTGGTGSGGTDSGTGGTDPGTGGSSTGGSSTGGTGGTDTPPPPSHTCDGGQQVCGPGLPLCENGMYCQLGCCMVVVR